MFFCIMNFGQILKLRFVGLKIFRSCSTTTFGHLHSVKLTSLKNFPRYNFFILFVGLYQSNFPHHFRLECQRRNPSRRNSGTKFRAPTASPNLRSRHQLIRGSLPLAKKFGRLEVRFEEPRVDKLWVAGPSNNWGYWRTFWTELGSASQAGSERRLHCHPL